MRNTCLYLFFGFLCIHILIQSCQSHETIRKAQYIINGRNLYGLHCENCHGTKGEGLGRLYPPLTDSTYLNVNRDQLACITKYGLSGEIFVNEQPFNTIMPPNPQLAPVEIAYILTYIGNSFGNEMEIFTIEEIQQSLEKCRQQASKKQ